MKCRNFAHRGFSGEYPENTMLAFEKALEIGCEGIEFDVHFSKDHELVIIHDEQVDRTAANGETGFVKDKTYEELCQIDFSYKFKGKYGFQRIPTLREYCELVKDKDIITNIELKTGWFEYEGIEKAVYDLVHEYGLEDRVIVSSFNHYSVMRMKELDPNIYCGFLADTWILEPAPYVKKYGIEAYHPGNYMLNDAEVEGLKKEGVKINVWTVNEVDEILQMIHWEVDGIISNYPNRVKELLKATGLR